MNNYKIYLDNCTFNRPFDKRNQLSIVLEADAKLYIQQSISEKKIDLVWSYILDFENDANPFKERRFAVKQWQKLAITDIDENEQILKNAINLTKLGLKSKDALHVACAMFAECDFFITTDSNILKKLKKYSKIRAISPIEFIYLFKE